MSSKELEVLLAVAESTSELSDEAYAGTLIKQLGQYLLEAPFQKFMNVPKIRDIHPSPWQLTTKTLVSAILSLGDRFPVSLRPQVENLIDHYLAIVAEPFKDGQTFEVYDTSFPLLFSFQGFLDALTEKIGIFGPTLILEILQRLNRIVNPDLLLHVERVVSKLRSEKSRSASIWIHSLAKYSEDGYQLGAMLLSSYVCDFGRAVASTFIKDRNPRLSLIDRIGLPERQLVPDRDQLKILNVLRDYAIDQVHSLDDGADYIELASPEKINLAYSIKAVALEVLSICVYYDVLDVNVAVQLVESSLRHEHGMSSPNLSLTVFKLGSFLCLRNNTMSSLLVRYLPFFVVNPAVSPELVFQVSASLIRGLKTSSQDVIVSTIYTLINILTIDDLAVTSPLKQKNSAGKVFDQFSGAQQLNSDVQEVEQRQTIIFRNVITSVVAISATYDDPQISTLASTVLKQKLNSSNPLLDKEVVLGLSKLAVHVPEKEFKSIMRLYHFLALRSLQKKDSTLSEAITSAQCGISASLDRDHELYDSCLKEYLVSIISRGDVQELEHHRPHVEISATATEICAFIPGLSALLPQEPEKPYETTDNEILTLFRNAWFNMVVHGFSRNSPTTLKYQKQLEIIARSTPPLVSETSANKMESELDLNTVLRRGSSHHNVNNQKEIMSNIFSLNSFEFRTIHYPKLMFLSAAVLLETLRAKAGNCSKVLLYFGDPGFKSGDTGRYMGHIATDVTKEYITNVVKGGSGIFTADEVAVQLKEMLILCCHRAKAIQDIAVDCCHLLISAIPSALCRSTSLYTLLDLLTLLWTSCLDAETDEYEPRTVFTAAKSNIRLELSDSYQYRHNSLKRFHEMARKWMKIVLNVMNFDVKTLLLGYLADTHDYRPINDVALGFTFALEMGGSISVAEPELFALANSTTLHTDTLSGFLSQYVWQPQQYNSHSYRESDLVIVKEKVDSLLQKFKQKKFSPIGEVRDTLYRASSFLSHPVEGPSLARSIVQICFKLFTESSIQLGISLWLWAITEVPSLKPLILSEVANQWEWSVESQLGLYSRKHDKLRPEFDRMEYKPSNKAELDHDAKIAYKSFSVHLLLIRFLSSTFQASNYDSKHLLKQFTRVLNVSLRGLEYASFHPLARSVRFELIKFALEVLDVHVRFSARISDELKNLIISSALTWFYMPAMWPFGGNKLRLRSDVKLLSNIAGILRKMEINPSKATPLIAEKSELLLLFLNDELSKMTAWLDPLQQGKDFRDNLGKKIFAGTISYRNVEDAWKVSPVLAVYLVGRYKGTEAISRLESLVALHPIEVISVPESLAYFLTPKNTNQKSKQYLLYWAAVSPVESINLFLPSYGKDSIALQYAMRSLESHDVNTTFFYVPQLVQSLRYDSSGYVERYILETAQISQLFAHQIIWNILANSYKDEDSSEPDSMKPILDRVTSSMIASFKPEDKEFYEREFGFFSEVTSISGKLKPFIKKTKAEKKTKIDEEIAKIKVDVGVYLPSNPDGVVLDIDRKSGKPLQSHAKAPFMATFRIKKEVRDLGDDNDIEDSDEATNKIVVESWQSAIFKVGDDCRQDVLAIQIIAVFRTIFNSYGLDLYVFPYRVTATAPGCGVIDVLPRAISRDMLGREAVNGLYEYFTSKFGGEDSIQFQHARNNFVKSLAAYSVISYLIQFKDRHNGNIMYDDKGHILHIDFGFCFDIVPGGVKFEVAPFKLTAEMVAVMGGSTKTQAYRWFEELCVKAFLACRPHAESIIQVVLPMLDSGLPCFKGETTIKKLRARFVLEKSERDAALHFRGLIKKSYESIYTKGYDEFQRITNGIPY